MAELVIRRIRHHVETHNWFAVFIDLLIVVAGVFLGTQANNWNEERIKRSEAADYRREIIEDLKSNELDLSSRAAYYAAARAHAISTLEALQAPGAKLGVPFLIDAYQASEVWLRPLTRTGYDEMVGNGLSGSVGDRETRSRLTAYYTQIKQFDVTALALTSYRERLRRTLPYALQSAIRSKCGDRVATLRGGAQIAKMATGCTVQLDEAAARSAVVKLQSADLVDDLTRHVADIDQKLSGFERFGRAAHELRLRLQSMDG